MEEFPNVDPILDPKYAGAVAAKHFSAQLSTARDLAGYWSNLLKRCFASADKSSVQDLVLILGFFRNGLKAFDGCLVCLDVGAVGAAQFAIRSLWEAELFAKWILSNDRLRWSRQAYVADLRIEREWALRVVEGTAQSSSHEASWRETFGKEAPSASPEVRSAAPARIKELNQMLTRPVYAEIYGWFDSFRGSRPFEPDWYKPGPDAPKTVGEMTKKLGRSAEYAMLYSLLSYHTHSTRPSAGFRVLQDGHVVVEPIRAFRDFGHSLTLATTLALRFLWLFTETYRSGEAETLRNQHKAWREGLQLPPIVEGEDYISI